VRINQNSVELGLEDRKSDLYLVELGYSGVRSRGWGPVPLGFSGTLDRVGWWLEALGRR
jgi:hypothetical protein